MQSIDSRQLAVKVLWNKDLKSILDELACGCPPLSPCFGDRVGTGNCPLATDNCFSINTNGQERRARRILPYNQSMGRVGNAVKLRK
jgi:hypothetical protein